MGKGRHRNNKNQQGKAATASTTTPVATKTSTPGYTKVVTLPKRTEVKTDYKPTVILADAFLQKVAYLHKNVKANTEWSAILLYSNKQGSIDDANNWVILVEDCILMDIGTSAYTEYDMEAGDEYATNRWMDHLEKGGKIGHLHTHHNMKCYFSGTDMEELHDNAPNHNYYLSLIVNYRDINAWCAKVAVCGEEKTTGTMETVKSWIGAKGPMEKKETETLKDTKRMLYLMDCKLVPESDTHVPEGLQQRIDEIVKKKAAATPTRIYNQHGTWSQGASTGSWKQGANNVATTNKGTESKGTTKYSAGVMSMGNGNTRLYPTTPAKVHTPYSAPGTDIDDIEDDGVWSGLFDTNGNPIPQIAAHSEEPKAKRGTVVERFSPKVCGPILVQIISQDMATKESLETCLMTMEGATDAALDLYMDECAGLFMEYVNLHFPETLTALHLHAIAVSMYYALAPYEIFTAYDAIDHMLTEYLKEDGEFQPTVIKQMTGVDIEDQVCLEKEEEVKISNVD